MAFTKLPVERIHRTGMVPFGHVGGGLLMGAALYKVLTAFANGGSAVTGVEAISNGVPAFRVPEWRNARETLVIMGSTLGAMFLGLSILAAKTHVAPFEKGTPTVISQIGKVVYGRSPVGNGFYLALQAGTALILILAANTSFADFPRLASFHAGDNFMPRQLTKRGHRLVFSNGIIFLAVASIAVVIAADAKVDNLIGLYAIGVFTSFTLSQGGMAKHHITHKEPGWRVGLFINGTGSLLSLVVDIIIAVTKFKRGAWIVILLVPALVAVLVRLNRAYEAEEAELEEDAPKAAEVPIMRRHVVVVFIDTLNVAAARAMQYARTLSPDELRAVHFDLDPIRTEDLTEGWSRLGLSELPLDVIECPQRRITRGAAEVVAESLADGETEVTVLLPRLEHPHFWHRFLHDRTADAIAEAIGVLPHANVTIVPYHLGQAKLRQAAELVVGARPPTPPRQSNGKTKHKDAKATTTRPAGTEPIASATFRVRGRFSGRVHSVRVQPSAGTPTLEFTLVDDTGSIRVVFLGRRQIAGIKPGTRLIVDSVVGEHRGRLALLTPSYEILADEHRELPPSGH
jgi:hypothetical protein